MKKYVVTIIFILLLTVSLGLNPVLAGTTPVQEPRDWLGTLNGTGTINPYEVDFRKDIIPRVLNIAFVGIFITSLIFLLLGGIKWIMSGGAKDSVAKAKSTITYALIGLALALSSFIIFQILQQFIGARIF